MAEEHLAKARPWQLDAHAKEIRRLRADEGLGLKDIQGYLIREHQLYVTENMLKKRFRKMNLRVKNNRFEEMVKAAQHYQVCLASGSPFYYAVSGHKIIDSSELLRYARRRGCVIVDGVFIKQSVEIDHIIHVIQADRSDSTMVTQDTPLIHSEEKSGIGISNSMVCDHAALSSVRTGTSDLKMPTVIHIKDEPTDCSIEYPSDNGKSGIQTSESMRRASSVATTVSSEHSTACINPTTALFRVQNFLNHHGNARCSNIFPPDVYRYHQDLIRATDICVAFSFESGQVLLSQGQWIHVNIYTREAIRYAVSTRDMFTKAANLSKNSMMRKARTSLRAGLSCLYFAISYCLPVALYHLVQTMYDLLADGYGHIVRVIAYYASQWAKRHSRVQQMENIFSSICKIDDSDLAKVLCQALTAINNQQQRFAGEADQQVCENRLEIIHKSLRCESTPSYARLFETAKSLHDLRKGDLDFEIRCLIWMARAKLICNEPQSAVAIVEPALSRTEFLDGASRYKHCAHLLQLLALSLWELGSKDSAVEKMEAAVESALKRYYICGYSYLGDCCKYCSDMHRELGNLAAADKYAKLASSHKDNLESDADDLVHNFSFLACADDDLKQGETDKPSVSIVNGKRPIDSTDWLTPFFNVAPWKPIATAEEHNIVLSSLCDEDDDFHLEGHEESFTLTK